MKILSKNPLFFAFLFPAMVDATLTLVGQGASYWFAQRVYEASPAYYALQLSPWLFVGGSLVWFIFWYWLMKRLKEPWNLFFVFLFVAGHSWGSSSWLWKMARENGWFEASNQVSVMLAWGAIIMYFAVIALVAARSFQIYMKQKTGKL